MKPSKQPNDPWAKLDAMMAKEKEPTGPEWFTVYQYQSRYGLSLPQARGRMEGLVADGTLETWSGAALAPSGHKRIITKYRIKNTE
jgi:hypothetical protein